jgi:formylglycine-generating enzyme required for sulfatase activity
MTKVSMKNRLHAMHAGLCAVGLAAGVALHAGAQQVPTTNAITPSSIAAVLTVTGVPLGDTALIQYSDNSGPWANLTNFVVKQASVDLVDKGYTTIRQYKLIDTPAVAPVSPPPSGGMALIPAGTFTMGDVIDKGNHVHTESVSGFYIDTNLVTYALWQQVYGYATANGYSFVHAGAGKGGNHPVQMVDWFDALKWCNARSEMEGLTPCYYTDASQTTVYATGEPNLSAAAVKWTASGYRLPTEAEFEKAARGGVYGQRFPWGNTVSEAQANYLGNTLPYPWDKGPDGYNQAYGSGNFPYTSPVGSFAANAYGLTDMGGNVREWCWDWYYSTYYMSSPASDPHGPSMSSLAPGARVLRGGAWALMAPSMKCGYRDYTRPSSAGNNIGFRCVRAQGD